MPAPCLCPPHAFPGFKRGPLRLVLCACLLAALSAAFAFSAPLWAQESTEPGYIDLAILYQHSPGGSGNNPKIAYSVHNQGTAPATGVTVSFLLKNLQPTEPLLLNDSTPATISGKADTGPSNHKFAWQVGTVLPGDSSQQLLFQTTIHSALSSQTVTPLTGQLGTISATASALQPENEMLRANNHAKIYSFADSSSGASKHMGANRLALLLSATDLHPEAGGAVNFTLNATNRGIAVGDLNNSVNLITDIEIGITLSRGLQFNPSWTPPSELAISGQSATWRPSDVDLHSGNDRPNSRSIIIETKLTTDTLENIPLRHRCISAHVSDSTPPPTLGYPFASLNQCLGSDPPVLFQEGPIALFTSFPCTATKGPHQCRTDSGIAVAARVPSSSNTDFNTYAAEAHLRSYGIGRRDTDITQTFGRLFLDPESIFIHVQDPHARVKDSNANAVSSISWQTAQDSHAEIGDQAVGGVGITYTRKDITNPAAWNSLGPRTVTATGTDGGNPPGAVKIRIHSNRRTFFNLPSPTYSATKNPFNITSVVPYFADFETLGTYHINYSLTMTDSANAQHTDSGRYTFHVGPVAELEARDAGANPEVPSDQQAFSVSAINNGPDTAPAAQVTLTGLGDTYVSHSVTAGTFDPTTGIWQVGELKDSDFYQAVHDRDGETLTIITSAAADAEITAAITNTKDYEVCIDSTAADVDADTESACKPDAMSTNTWHTAKYYDYISGNESATIKAKAGTAASRRESQPAPEVKGTPESIIVLKWPDVETLKGRAVTHYQVEKWVAGNEEWEGQEPEKVLITMWLDDDPGEDPQYRVRAVNEANAHGPWSETVFGEQNIVADAAVEVDFDPDTDGAQRSRSVEEGDEIEYTIKLKSRPSFVVHVAVDADEGLTVIPPPVPPGVQELPGSAGNVITFHPAEYKTAKRVRVKVNDDLVIAAARTAKIRHRLPGTGGINRSAGYAGVTVRDLTLTVNDATYKKAGFASLGEKSLLLAAGETQSYEIRPLVKPTANLTITLTSSDTTVATIDDTDPDTDGIQNTITFRPGDFRAERDTLADGTEFYAVPVNDQGPGVVSVTAVGAGDANITITAVSGDSNFNTTKGAASQAVEVVAAKPQVSAPEFSTSPTAQTATVGTPFTYTPEAATDAQNDAITYAASLTGGGALPSWLTFTPSTLTFSGTPQVCDAPASLPITITASDGETPAPNTGSASFTLTVNGASSGPAWHQTVSKADYEEYARGNSHLGEGGNPNPAYYNRPPLFLEGVEATRSLAENSAADVKVGLPVLACDPDGDPLLYKWLDGADAAAFALDEDTGQLTTVSGVTYDYEGDFGDRAAPGYDFWVIVEEQGTVGGYLSAIRVAVNLTDDPNN